MAAEEKRRGGVLGNRLGGVPVVVDSGDVQIFPRGGDCVLDVVPPITSHGYYHNHTAHETDPMNTARVYSVEGHTSRDLLMWCDKCEYADPTEDAHVEFRWWTGTRAEAESAEAAVEALVEGKLSDPDTCRVWDVEPRTEPANTHFNNIEQTAWGDGKDTHAFLVSVTLDSERFEHYELDCCAEGKPCEVWGGFRFDVVRKAIPTIDQASVQNSPRSLLDAS